MSQNLPQLRDIHLPAEPSWWPPAPLWWLLAAAGVVVLVFGWRRLRRYGRDRRWRRLWLHELDVIGADHARHGDHARTAAAVSQLLRRASLVVDARAAALPSARWVEFLRSRKGGDVFAGAVGQALLLTPWQPHADSGGEELIAATRHWLTTALPGTTRHA